MSRFRIQRLGAEHADAIVACFDSAYAGTYANETFNHAETLVQAMARGQVRSVGALTDEHVAAHMAMTTLNPDAIYPELGNTVVNPQARGEGLAWKVGAQLREWCLELGYQGFVHYPTAAHHIMQRQSVKAGFETGVMLGYIPAETHAGVGAASNKRDAATIVFEAIAQPQPQLTAFLPERWSQLIRRFADEAGLPRTWHTPSQTKPPQHARVDKQHFVKRGLQRLTVHEYGTDLENHLEFLHHLNEADTPTHQLDLLMSDPNIELSILQAIACNFVFCGWLPGFGATDVLRLQRLDLNQTNLAPELVNATAVSLLNNCIDEIGEFS